MMYKIKTGHGVTARPNHEIVVLVSSIHRLVTLKIPFVFTDAHAYMKESKYYDDISKLGEIDWELLQSKNFTNDPEDPGRQGRYQAEALIHKHVPIEALLGIGCYDDATKITLETAAKECNSPIKLSTVPKWYF